ncbi:uncharacterized protein LAESUDRAFT_816725 [Laetiporus sulphureus 93-53]|uniref:E3 ubiquitin-protein ligase PEP5 n=1 Tax=Laetiporus sulphureus 93-53 TaxID=1314785 RepID=A0A165B1G0_9APHY|nr:uncharacterized protein LAESUDRAFT_816725 [Laetiporus sulphureus 93-53]KZT00051.1 hypothetical protein LAESUDRAFT_816725 [Laetiporus sulphureus 93-53]
MSAQSAVLSAPVWRQFTFFDVVPVKDIHDLANPPEIFKGKTPEISTIIPSSLGPLVADIHGSVYLLNREFEIVKSWIAHTSGRVTHMGERKGTLITLGEEDTARHPFLKVWDLEHSDKKTGAPVLLRSTKVQSGSRPHPVTTIALSETLSHLAIGLGDGTVLLYRHLDQSVFSGSTSLTSLPKARVIFESPTEPITGLGFCEPDEDTPNMYLFIVTLNRVLTYQVSGKGHGAAPTVVSEVGCGLGCATMDLHARNMIVAKDEAIFICGTDSRGSSYAYEGQKASIHTHLTYVVIVSPPFFPSGGAASATVRNFVAKNSSSAGTEITKLTVFDPDNRLVAYSGTFAEGVREVLSVWGKLYVLSNDGNLSCLEEKPTPVKLDMLYRKGLYKNALTLAKTQQLDESSVADIHRQFGDHLYSKGDYDGAMQQYIKTIGHVQPSYVIRKFLDAQRIHNLVTYLQELHSLGRANADHTTLLLNTYTKLKDVARLDSFIKRESSRATDELPFDLDTAIRVCRQAGYFEHASYLAKKYERHEDYLRIQIEDAGNYKDALVYLRRLGAEAAEANLARYGRAMLNNLPEETTQLLIDLCTSLAPLPFEDEEEIKGPTRQASGGGPSYLSYLALNRSSTPAPATPTDGAAPSSASTMTARPGGPARRDSVQDVSRTATPPPATPTNPSPTKARVQSVKRPSPRLYFAHFIDHMDYFVRFLESVALRRWGQTVDPNAPHVVVENDPNADEEAEKRDQIAVWNTLLELYLIQDGASVEQTSSPEPNKALRVLQSDNVPYDPTHALILCSTRSFTPGLILLWERSGMYEDILRFWMDAYRAKTHPDAPAEVVRALNKYGDDKPGLYPLVLRFLTSTPELLSRHAEDLQNILRIVDERGIMQPLSVVQVLSRNGVTSVGLVKQWLMTRIKQAQQEVETDQQLIDSYRNETRQKLRQVEELSDPDQPKVFHVTQCSECQGQLDLPSVHFMCHHSYHQRCLGDHETECPKCARAHGMIMEIRRNNERLADQHDVFLQEVREGGFAALAAGFSRGSLNMSRLEDVAA